MEPKVQHKNWKSSRDTWELRRASFAIHFLPRCPWWVLIQVDTATAKYVFCVAPLSIACIFVITSMGNADLSLASHGNCPAGDGYSSRAEDSILNGCIPVVIMDEVQAVFENILDWSSFSIRVAEVIPTHWQFGSKRGLWQWQLGIHCLGVGHWTVKLYQIAGYGFHKIMLLAKK